MESHGAWPTVLTMQLPDPHKRSGRDSAPWKREPPKWETIGSPLRARYINNSWNISDSWSDHRKTSGKRSCHKNQRLGRQGMGWNIDPGLRRAKFSDLKTQERLLCNPALSLPNHIMATTWQTSTNAGGARQSQDGKCPLLRSRATKLGKASITKKGVIPRQSLDDVLKASCCWEVEHPEDRPWAQVTPEELTKLFSYE